MRLAFALLFISAFLVLALPSFAQLEVGGGGSKSLTITKQGSGAGIVTDDSSPPKIDCGTLCEADYDEDSAVILTASAGSGSTFGGWGGDCPVPQSETCNLIMDADQSVTATFNVPFYDPNVPFYDPFDFFIQQVKKRKFYTVPWYLNNLINIGKVPFVGDIRAARWRVTADGKLRGSLASGNVLIDLISGFSQLAFRGGPRGLTGQISYYVSGNYNVTELIDQINKRIYANKKTFSAEGEPVELSLLFNQATLFGKMAKLDGVERFFITTSSAKRSISIDPLISKVPIRLIGNFSPSKEASSLIEEFFRSLENFEPIISRIFFHKALAATPSLSKILRWRSELIGLRSDEVMIVQIVGDYKKARESYDQLLGKFEKGEWLDPEAFYDPSFDILYQLNDQDIAELEGLLVPHRQSIAELKSKLGGYIAFDADWLSVDAEEAAKLAEDLGVSKNLAGFLLSRSLPESFVLTVVRGDRVIMASCEGEVLVCKKSVVNPAVETFIRQQTANYEAITAGEINSYQAIDNQVQSELSSVFSQEVRGVDNQYLPAYTSIYP